MPPVLIDRAGAAGILHHALDVMSLTATIRIPTIAISMTAPRMALYDASAPPSPVYSAMVGARTDASTITYAARKPKLTSSDGNCDDRPNDSSHVCHVAVPLLSVYFFPFVYPFTATIRSPIIAKRTNTPTRLAQVAPSV